MIQILIAFLGGILMGLTTAPSNAWYFAWIALVPLWILLFQKGKDGGKYTDKKYKIFSRIFNQKTAIAFAWGCGYHGLALFWITGIHPMTWMGVPWLASLGIAIFCWFFITFWGAVLVVAWFLGINLIQTSNFKLQTLEKNLFSTNLVLKILIATALWCSLESIWSQGELWWSSLSYTQSPYNLAILQLGQLSGPSTITALIVGINGLVAELLIYIKQKGKIANFSLLFIPLIICSIAHLGGFYLYIRPIEKPAETAIKVGIIQGNIPNEIKLYAEGLRKAIAGYTSGYETLVEQGVEAVLTPEGALPFFQENLMQSFLVSAIREKGVMAWVGAFAKEKNSYFNSLFTITGTGEIFSRYDKVNLVPMGEYVPFREIIGSIVRRLSPLDEHQVSGNPNHIIDTPFGRAIVGICYDSAFADHFRRQAARGGEFIITASNNAHYSESMPAQHHALDVMRAIETDRWAARATNTGYSAIVDPRGRTLWISSINTYEVHADTIYRRQTKTLYVRWGDWLTVVLVILGIGGYLYHVMSIGRGNKI